MTATEHATRVTLAGYIGAVSRWCSLTGNGPTVTADENKGDAELAAFQEYLNHLAERKRNYKTLQF